MVDQAIATAAPNASRTRTLRRAANAAGALAVLAAVVYGPALIRDPKGPAGLWAFVLGLLGQGATADAVRSHGLDPLYAKLTIMVVALAIGIFGIWFLYAGLNSATDLLGRTWSARVRPYV